MADLQPQQALGDANRPRRATYVHVSDVTSAYNIDHTLLEQELSRVMQESMAGRDPGASATASKQTERLAGGVPAELDTSQKKRLQPPKGGSNMVV